jgi:hypothetical protein
MELLQEKIIQNFKFVSTYFLATTVIEENDQIHQLKKNQ